MKRLASWVRAVDETDRAMYLGLGMLAAGLLVAGEYALALMVPGAITVTVTVTFSMLKVVVPPVVVPESDEGEEEEA